MIIRFFVVPNPDKGTTAKKLFNCWNSLLSVDCDDQLYHLSTSHLLRQFGIPLSILTRSSETHEAKGVEDPLRQAEEGPKRDGISPRLELQVDGSYRVSVYDVCMAIIKLAGRKKFFFVSEKHYRLLMQVKA